MHVATGVLHVLYSSVIRKLYGAAKTAALHDAVIASAPVNFTNAPKGEFLPLLCSINTCIRHGYTGTDLFINCGVGVRLFLGDVRSASLIVSSAGESPSSMRRTKRRRT